MNTRITVFVLAAFLASGAASADSATDFGARRHVAEPRLTVTKEPQLCASFLAEAKELFNSTAIDVDLAAVAAKRLIPLQTVVAFPSDTPDSEGQLRRIDLDLDATGHKQVLIYRPTAHGWRGSTVQVYVFPSIETFDAASGMVRAWPRDGSDDSQSTEALGARQFFPGARSADGTVVWTGNDWAWPLPFEWHGRYYFFEGSTEWTRQFDASTRVFRLHGDGTIEESCRIEVPKDDAKFEALPAVRSFLRVLRRVGTGGPDCGTMHFALSHDEGALASERRAAVRPWATSRANDRYYGYDARTEALLAVWAHDELWNWREYQTLLHHAGPAQESIAAYLVTQFGLAPGKARARAPEILHALIGARVLVPQSYEADEPVNPLRYAIFSRDEALLTTAIAGVREGRNAATAQAVLSAVLADAVEWPLGLERLLAEGAEPNRRNEFGKTPLMVAAHMNRIDSARTLLGAGARINAMTSRSTDECGFGSPDTPPDMRTALMYAAENASPPLMKLLLDAGADAEGVEPYLARNPRLTAPERSLGVRGLVAAADRFRGPGFNCTRARTTTEKAICDSEVLRIFDAELARAYEQVRLAEGRAATVSQRDWLRQRDRECTSATATTGVRDVVECLAESTRTRIRYLHNRIAAMQPEESKPKESE